jgi:hypothetical protein
MAIQGCQMKEPPACDIATPEMVVVPALVRLEARQWRKISLPGTSSIQMQEHRHRQAIDTSSTIVK